MRSRFLLVLILNLAMLATSAFSQGPPPTPPAPENVSSTYRIASNAEPGTRLVITGQVFASDGITPASGVIVYAYQTDATGEYHDDVNGVARLHGWAKTDVHGHFEFRTIVPAPYPKLAIPAHVHFHAYGAGYPLQWTEELMFAGDPRLSSRQIEESKALGQFANIQPMNREQDGVWHCQIRLRLSSGSNYPAQYRHDSRIW